MEDEQEIDLDQITDENLLQSLLDQTDDPEDRKVIRDRIKELKATKKNERDEKLTKSLNTREDMLQAKKKEAEQHKQRTMQMYDNMAKSQPAGAKKDLDVNILKSETKTTTTTQSSTTKTSTSSTSNRDPPYKLTNLPISVGLNSADLVEDSIKRRQREAEEKKRRILAAFDIAARSSPAGPKDVDFDVANNIDLDEYEQRKNSQGGATFQMAGGVPIVKRTVSVPASPPVKENVEIDAMEKALRDRQRECAERKQKILQQYTEISKQPAGPKVWV